MVDMNETNTFSEGDRVASMGRLGTVLSRWGSSYWVVFDDAKPVLHGIPETVRPETLFGHMLTKVDEPSRIIIKKKNLREIS